MYLGAFVYAVCEACVTLLVCASHRQFFEYVRNNSVCHGSLSIRALLQHTPSIRCMMEADWLIVFVVFEGGKDVVCETLVAVEYTFDASLVVFHGDGIAMVNAGLVFVFESLGFLAD